jgi:hypothetical protein
VKEVFPTLLKQNKWTELQRDVTEGDVMLRKDEKSANQSYEYARVVRRYNGSERKVRSADVAYDPRGKRARTTTCHIHNLTMAVPVEEQGMGEDGGEENSAYPETTEGKLTLEKHLRNLRRWEPPG